MKRLLLINFIVFISIADANSQDTVNAKFFPLHVGNYYVYHYDDIQYHYYITCRITKDSLINGKKYFKFTDLPYSGAGFYRYDSLTSNLLKFKPGMGCSQYPDDLIIDSLGSQIGDQLHGCDSDPHLLGERNDTMLVFSYSQLIYFRVKYMKGIGIYEICSGDPNPCEGRTSFRGAYINGVLIGDTIVTNIQQLGTTLPNNYQLHQNYPNPFNPATVIKFDIPKSSNATITIYDNTGRMVEKLVYSELSAGTYETVWNASGYASGIYFYRLEAGNFSQTKKMLLVR